MPKKGSKSPLLLSKAELIQRLDRRSRERYGEGFSEALLNDLIKDGLIAALERKGNIGLAPIFRASSAHYRRALQIKRFMARGISERDRLRIQLFLRSYGVEPWDVREALLRECVKQLRTLSAQIRFSYLDNDREIGPSHKGSLEKQLGTLDKRLDAAGLAIGADKIIQFSRDARSPTVGGLLAGWFYIDPDSEQISDRTEDALAQPDEKYIEARDAFRWVDRHCLLPILGMKIIDDPRYSTFMFLKMLEFKTHGVPWKLVLKAIPLLFMINFLKAIRLLKVKST